MHSSQSILDNLNPDQQQAVINTDGPVLVLAGAGSGKTRVLTHKVAYILRNKMAKPWEILAVTFTNKAAGEMRARIEKLVDFDIQHLWVGTFHSIFARLLRRHGNLVGINPNFAIYDREDQIKLMKEVFAAYPNQSAGLTPKRAVGIVSSIKSGLRKLDSNDIQTIYNAYEARLNKYSALDFDDLLEKPLKLLRNNPEINNMYSDRFRYILVDEFQDTNIVQNELLKALWIKHKHITVVGDDDQSIYGWRGAEVTNILNFETNFSGAKTYRLERNYRSTKAILELAHAVISNNISRHPKKLWTEKVDLRQPQLINGFDDKFEAHKIVDVIRDCVTRGSKYSEVGILYRTNAQSRSLEAALRENSIPYTIVGGLKFYQRKEIKDLLAYLKVTLNPNDGIALLRIINFPSRGIGATTIGRLNDFANEQDISLWEALDKCAEYPVFSAGVVRKLKFFYSLVKSMQEESVKQDFPGLVNTILTTSGIANHYIDAGDEEAFVRLDNIKEFVAGVEEYVKNYPDRTIEDFLQEAALVSDVDEWDSGDLVSLMTIHCAKGLEFPVVFLTGLEDGLFPLYRDGDTDIEEERRLFYVGVTRSKDELYLTYAQNRRNRQGNISQFIREIPMNLIDRNGEQERQYHKENIRTYSSVKTSNYSLKTSPSGQKAFHRGEQVEHGKFGIGLVAGSELRSGDEFVTVFFQGYGAKKLNARIAKLKKI